MIKSVLVFLLISASIQRFEDRCETIPGTTTKPTKIPMKGLDLKNYLKENESNLKQSTTPFLFEYTFKDPSISDPTVTTNVKVAKRTPMREEYVITSKAVGNNMWEDELVKCQIDNTFLYIQKTAFGWNHFCSEIRPENVQFDQNGKPVPPNFELINGILHGQVETLPSYTNLLSPLDQGGYGKILKIKVQGNQEIALKRAKLSNMRIGEVQAMKLFQDTQFGPKFHGCFFDAENLYIAQELLSSVLDSVSFTNQFKTFPLKQKTEFFRKMAESVLAFEKMGWIHNDIKLANFMTDTHGNPKLIDFGFAARDGSLENRLGTALYVSPKRYEAKYMSPIFDTYSLAMSILLAMGGQGELLLTSRTHSSDGQAINWQTFPTKKSNEYLKLIAETISKNIQPVWGMDDPNEKDIDKQNLTTLISNIVIRLDESITTEKLIQQLIRIEQQLEAGKYRRQLVI